MDHTKRLSILIFKNKNGGKKRLSYRDKTWTSAFLVYTWNAKEVKCRLIRKSDNLQRPFLPWAIRHKKSNAVKPVIILYLFIPATN